MSIRRFLEAFGRQVPLFLPALAVGVVGLVVLRLGKTHPVVGARLRGGPTEGARVLSYRLDVVERHDDSVRAVPGLAVSVEARLSGGGLLRWQGTLDDEGAAAVGFASPDAIRGPVTLVVSQDGREEPLAETTVQVTRERWSGAARRRGGWGPPSHAAEGRAVNGLHLRAAAGRGAFAVPFADPLLVEVQKAGGAFAGTITCECDTAKEPRVPATIFAGPGGVMPVRASVRPLEHATSVPLVARDGDGTTARLDVMLTVVPGALHAERIPEGVRVESPIQRERAYVAIVTETERIAGGTVTLHGTERGTAEGVLPVALPANGAIWAVVSSEPDLRSAALVGWPIQNAPAESAAPMTFDVADVLAVDSIGDKVRRELRRARRARLLAALFAASAISLAAVLVVRRARSAQAALAAHLLESGADDEATTRMATSDGGAAGLVTVAVLTLVLAAALVGVFAAWI